MTIFRVYRELIATFVVDVDASDAEQAEHLAASEMTRLPLAHGEWRTVSIFPLHPQERSAAPRPAEPVTRPVLNNNPGD